jgi:UDP-glucose 4-epimerase
LVTGGAGFIGSHLCELLVAAGWRVAAVDDLSTGCEANLATLRAEPRFSLEVSPAGDAIRLERLAGECEAIFHLAAVVGVRRVMENTVETIEKNLHTTETVLRAAARFGRRLLVTSTSEVYGSNPKGAFSEGDVSMIGDSRMRRWCYAAGKLLDEFHAFAYHQSSGLPVTVVRLFNTIGPRQVGRYGMVVPTFVGQALRGEPLTVHGSGEQSRCFAWVGDVVRCIVALCDCPAAVGEIFNIGSDREVSIMELARMVLSLSGSRSQIVTRSHQEVYGENFADMERRQPDLSKLRRAIGFVPQTTLEEALTAILTAMRGG